MDAVCMRDVAGALPVIRVVVSFGAAFSKGCGGVMAALHRTPFNNSAFHTAPERAVDQFELKNKPVECFVWACIHIKRTIPWSNISGTLQAKPNLEELLARYSQSAQHRGPMLQAPCESRPPTSPRLCCTLARASKTSGRL